jgi:hypothetical protein
MTMARPKPPRHNLFKVNLTLMVTVGGLGTLWFGRHVEPWFTEIAVFGGGVTVWAVLRLVLEWFKKAGGVDPWASTRTHLASTEWTVLLVTLLVVVLMLWAFTASVYLRFDPRTAKVSSYQVSVGSKTAEGTFVPAAELSADRPIVGRPIFGWSAPGPLVCRITTPVGFEDLDCALDRWGALTVRVPGNFTSRPRLRVLPAKELWARLPPADVPEPPTRYDLLLRIDGAPAIRHEDLRLRALELGVSASVRDVTPAAKEELRSSLRGTLRAEGVPDESIEQVLPALVGEPKVWDGIHLHPGKKLELELRVAERTNPQASTTVNGFPITVTVGTEPFQTVWLRPKGAN